MNNDILKVDESINFIDIDDNNFLFEISQKISYLKIYRSEVKIDNFILSDIQHPTEYAKFLQIKLEMYNIMLNIKNTYYTYKEKIYTNELIEFKIKNLIKLGDEESIIKAKIKSVQLEKNIVQLNILKNDINSKIKELKHFYKRYNDLIRYESLTEQEKIEEEKNIFKYKILQDYNLFTQKYGERTVENLLKQ